MNNRNAPALALKGSPRPSPTNVGTTRALAKEIANQLEALTRGIIPERVYTPEEAAELCGWRDPKPSNPGKSFRESTRGRLPAVRLTPRGQRMGYYGRDLIRFIEEQRETV